AERAAVVAEGHAAAHAALGLAAQLWLRQLLVDLAVVLDALGGIALRQRRARDLEKAAGVGHRYACAPTVPSWRRSWTIRLYSRGITLTKRSSSASPPSRIRPATAESVRAWCSTKSPRSSA